MINLSEKEFLYKKICEIINKKNDLNTLNSYELQKYIKNNIVDRLKSMVLNKYPTATDIITKFNSTRNEPEYSDKDNFNDEMASIRFKSNRKIGEEILSVEQFINILFVRKKEKHICIQFKETYKVEEDFFLNVKNGSKSISFFLNENLILKKISYENETDYFATIKSVIEENSFYVIKKEGSFWPKEEKIGHKSFGSFVEYTHSEYKDLFLLENDLELHSEQELKMLKVLDKKINKNININKKVI